MSSGAKFYLPVGVVHIWRVDTRVLQKHLSKYLAYLSKDERQRASQYRLVKNRNAFIITRNALRMLLGQYLNISPKVIQFAHNLYGKLYLAKESDLYFNLSHASGLSVLAFTRTGEIGIDIEYTDRHIDVMAIAERYFTKNEQSWLYSLLPEQRKMAFIYCWVRKEAYIKALGLGFNLPIDSFDVIPPQADITFEDDFMIGEWHLLPLELTAPYLGAVCFGASCSSKYYYEYETNYV